MRASLWWDVPQYFLGIPGLARSGGCLRPFFLREGPPAKTAWTDLVKGNSFYMAGPVIKSDGPSAAPAGPIKPIVYLLALSAGTAGLLFGLDVGVISGALKFIKAAWGVDDHTLEYIVSALLVGATVGAATCGQLSYALGRRMTLLVSAVIFLLGSLGCAMAGDATVLIMARLFLGLAVGMASFVAPLYLSEVSPPHLRGAMVSMYQLMITIGIVVAFVSDTYFATAESFGANNWRWMLGVLAVPAAIMFVAVLALPRSPRWLMMRGREAEAREVLVRIRNTEEEIEAELMAMRADLAVSQNGFQLFSQNSNFRRAVFLGFALQVIQQLTGINVVMYYAPKIFELAGYSSTKEQMICTVIVGLVNVFSTFIAIFFVDRWGRKPIMYAGFVVMGIAMSAVGLLFKSGKVQETPSLAVALIIVFIIGFAMSAGPIVWVLCSEIFPLNGRDFGLTVSTCTNWIVNAIVGVTFLTLLKELGEGNTFLLYGAVEIAFFAFFIFFVPETKGVTLEHLSTNLLAGKPLRDLGGPLDPALAARLGETDPGFSST